LPNHKSCAKRVKTSEADRIRNRALRTTLRAAVKAVRNETNKEEALKKLKTVSITLDKAASYKLIHRKNASRNKSRLARFVQKLG
jgi:small subunit ribosomal protein S20